MSLFRRRTTNGRTSSQAANATRGRNSSTVGNAPTTISSSSYASRCRELMAIDRALRALGGDTFFDLPSITVIGGQSAGKSSLVEAVSGINVPRDSGTCTRCPMECSMSSSDNTWSCSISLRFDHNAQGVKVDPNTHAFGTTITDRSAVELWLRRAQAAILSPHISYENFYIKTEQELRDAPPDAQRLPFSRNAVLVDVRDPDITDLSFIDLPGLIQNDSPDVIDVIRDLAVSRIENSNTLILVTIPMSDDLQNQQAAKLARDADPAGERTIAVLTKPDNLGEGALGSRQTWLDILEGRRHPLTHGYYCVRLPDDAERKRRVSRADSERRAAEFFDSTQPWRGVTDRSRFGVDNLATFLSQLLVQRIESNLPTLRNQLNDLLARYTAELLEIPPAPSSEPAAEILLRTTAFCKEFAAAVAGNVHKGLAQSCRQLYQEFKTTIRNTCPDFRPFVGYTSFSTPVFADPEPQDPGATVGTDDNVPLDLLDVRKVIKESVSWELPTYVPFDATKALVVQCTSKWKAPSVVCFNAVVDVSALFLNRLTATHFGQFTRLEEYIRALTHAELDGCKVQALQTLEKLLALETDPLFTQNTHLFVTESRTWLARYTSVRNWSRIDRDEYEDELTLMSKVRAYWQIAYQRVIDYVPLMIEHEFNHRLAARLEGVLFEELLQEPNASARMQELLTEDPAISERRGVLERKIEQLYEIKERLDGLS
ncbi:P-loop containing nucleoside triphosphate hydrolase protein [Mycena pura]|uniref:P-loop containing nucleoside triphosphate hydrolase protein n=1 Tax=Mycena pura TaxID=153505 RepID=A0AAD6VEU4_9AGAR|nr:P-loop containing nucleoside triphosphate hydrolase protein [Mycena pura]